MYVSLCPRKRWDRGDLMLKLCLILIKIIFKLPFQILFVFILVEMVTSGRRKKVKNSPSICFARKGQCLRSLLTTGRSFWVLLFIWVRLKLNIPSDDYLKY